MRKADSLARQRAGGNDSRQTTENDKCRDLTAIASIQRDCKKANANTVHQTSVSIRSEAAWFILIRAFITFTAMATEISCSG